MTISAFTPSLASSPHVRSARDNATIMWQVVTSLLPVAGFSCYAFGLKAFLVISTATMSCVLTEMFLANRQEGHGNWRDGSAVLSGLLLGLTLPPALSLWMAALGGIVTMALGKWVFGGLGANLFNPALVGRAFLQAAFPVAMTRWVDAFTPGRFTELPSSTLALPFMQAQVDGLSGATPLGLAKFEGVGSETLPLLLGGIGGSAGETCAVLILAGGIALALRKLLDWRIPVAILTTVFVLSGLLFLWQPDHYQPPWFHLFSGGLMLGAMYMATDMVTSPVTSLGVWLFGFLIGLLVVVIRTWGGLPEGVMYAILLANAATPLLNRLTQPKPFGALARGAV
jgi:electron transport complex protein RnfD